MKEPDRRRVEPWPLQRLAARLAAPPRGPRRVLLLTGALNPVHLGHVATLERTAEVLTAQHGFEVVGGFLSPSADGYLRVKSRGRVPFLDGPRRLELARLATAGHPWLEVGSWECGVGRGGGGWPDFPEVVADLEASLAGRFGSEAPGVLYVCGADHFDVARWAGLSGVCPVGRSGASVPCDPTAGVYGVPVPSDDPAADLSSSGVREALSRGDLAALRAALHPDVLAALLSKTS